MRVLINAISAKAGGIVTYTSNLIASLEQRGIDFLVAVPNSFPDGRSVLKVPASNYNPLHRLAWEQIIWRRIIRRSRADVLFSSANFGLLNSPVPQLLLMREGGLFDPLYLSTVAPCQGLDATIQRYLRRMLMLLSARHNDHIMTPTEAMRNMFLHWTPDLADRCSVNSYGTLVDTFKPTTRRPWRQDGTLKILYVSVYYPHKNPSDGLLASEILTRQGLPTTMRLSMELEQIKRVKGSARDLFHLTRGAEAGLLQTGIIRYTDLPATYADHDVFIFPSLSETFGHPMTEALASGIPVVAADVAVNREVLGDAALFYNPFHPSELAVCLRLLDEKPELRRELSEKGLRRVASLFDWNDHVDRLVEQFQRLANRV
ncbi:glycosyltransferase [Magnetospirillum gryphiswaldense]|uniref:Glycosyltransferase n=1 Tax=Magnetospirillum gryphiswaldense TaxID=55518 RepID=A4U198_9PROT|nr:glycosyltransferase [Magnetospirillum gryphiswaldense]AVM75564.1 Mannosylfructose-phosphate synthase [Magnetospirillum gryphiswaldense MSR-1]AVM79467.1 Mannosylfructose-phosphate synthase [Magnetospirillum gryphiswaldense]CAM76655.1 Glycosyltransferase [Magnetospirillum gryphiswaldense MSR-1]